MGYILDKASGKYVPEPTAEEIREKEEAKHVEIENGLDIVQKKNETNIKVVPAAGPEQDMIARMECIMPPKYIKVIDGETNEELGDIKFNEPLEVFRNLTDLTVFQINDKETGKPMCIISGYSLQIKFNREAITSVAEVEQCAEGLKKMFYNIIMDQLIGDR